MIAPTIFSKLIDGIKCFFSFFLDIPNALKKLFFLAKNDFYRLQYSLKHFAETNTNLAMYHLDNQNYNDAIFRFMLIDKFFRPGDPKINYWMGWTYFLKGNYKKAIIRLEKGASEDKAGLLNFIKNIDNITKVPKEIYSFHRTMNIEPIIDKFLSKGYDLPKNLVIQLVNVINKLPKKYSILEIGSNLGLVGMEINKRMNEGFLLSGTEISETMIKIQEECKRDKYYSEIINTSTEDYFAKNLKKKYDIIFTMDGFSDNSKLDLLFKQIADKLVTGGYFAFAVRISDETKFSKKYLEFSYKKDYLEQLLKSCNLKVITELNLELLMSDDYYIFVCKKPQKT